MICGMILGLEIGMLLGGLIAFFSGQFKLGKERIARGPVARIAGLLLMLPLPLSFAVGFVIGLHQTSKGQRFDAAEWQGTLIAVEVALLVVCSLLGFGLALAASSTRPGLLRRRWRLALVLALLVTLAAGLSGPYLWGWYHWYAGRSALRRYHAAEARTHFDACFRWWPDDPRLHLLAARAARQDGDLVEAERHLVRCQAKGDAPEEAVFEWALLHAAGGDLDKVETYLQGETRKGPEKARLAWEALAVGYMRMSRTLQALRCLNDWLDHEPDNTRALFLRGNLYRQVRTPPKAVPDYRRVVELGPERHEARWWLALCLLEVGRYEEAVTHLELLRQRQPGDVEVLVRLANGRNHLGQTRQARELLEAVLAEHPKHALALRLRGQMAMLAGQLSEAEVWLRRAAEAAPADYQTNWALYECLRQQEKTNDAEQQKVHVDRLKDRWERVSEITTRQLSAHPNDAALQCELGRLYLSLNEPDLGERWLLTALRQDPHCASAHAALADYYQQRGDTDKAAEHRRQAPPASASAAPPAARP